VSPEERKGKIILLWSDIQISVIKKNTYFKSLLNLPGVTCDPECILGSH